MSKKEIKKEKIAFIINPVSGTTRKEIIPGLIEELLDKDRFNWKVAYTRGPGDATILAAKYASKEYDIVAAVGGDGTVNEVGTGLVGTKTALAIIPTGSGNGLARHLCIPLRPSLAISLLNTAKTILIDYGTVNGKCFFCTCGVGFDALIGNKFATSKKRGFFAYVKSTLSEFLNYKPRRYSLKIDGEKLRRKAFLVTFANAAQYGNNAYISPDADIRDGLLDVCVLTPFPKYRALGIGMRLFQKTMDKSEYLRVIRGSEIVLKRKKPGEVHYDGEPCEMGKKIKIKVVPLGLRVKLA